MYSYKITHSWYVVCLPLHLKQVKEWLLSSRNLVNASLIKDLIGRRIIIPFLNQRWGIIAIHWGLCYFKKGTRHFICIIFSLTPVIKPNNSYHHPNFKPQ
jgi:hypothetical protein